MVLRCKQFWLDLAEVLDAQRVFPRAYLTLVSLWYIHTTDVIVRWYLELPADQRTTIVNTFVLGVLGASSGLVGYSYRVYAKGGRDWVNPPGVSSAPGTATVSASVSTASPSNG
jgi:hypothetical protein